MWDLPSGRCSVCLLNGVNVLGVWLGNSWKGRVHCANCEDGVLDMMILTRVLHFIVFLHPTCFEHRDEAHDDPRLRLRIGHSSSIKSKVWTVITRCSLSPPVIPPAFNTLAKVIAFFKDIFGNLQSWDGYCLTDSPILLNPNPVLDAQRAARSSFVTLHYQLFHSSHNPLDIFIAALFAIRSRCVFSNVIIDTANV